MTKTIRILLNAVPVLVMIGLIPVVRNDYNLAFIYALIIAMAFFVKREKSDLYVFIFGFFAMIVSEYLFVNAGVETFNRDNLFGIMPLWLPLLWAYGFVAIKRGIEIIGRR
ncbi:MAG: hypothetical protein AAB536_02005 [Patescibacteria group bacterium]